MAPLISPDTARYAIEATYLDQPVVNVFDFVGHDNSGTGADPSVIQTTGRALIDNWYDLCQGALVSGYRVDNVRVTGLNSDDDYVGDITAGNDHPLPFTGGAGGDGAPGSVAARVNKGTNGGRGTRSGRFYLAGVPMSAIDGNTLTAAYVSGLQDLVDTFLSEMTKTGTADVVQYFMTVIHLRGSVYQGNSQVTSLSAQTRLASQRRRLTLP